MTSLLDSPVVLVLVTGGIAAGLWLLATGLVPAWRPDPDTRAGRWRPRRERGLGEQATRSQRATRRATIAAAAGLVVGVYLEIPAAGLLVAVVVWIAPTLTAGAAEAEAAIARLEALGDWTRRIGDLLSTGAGLEQAMDASARSCPAPIAPEVTALT
ncbi:MAG: type II secretion system F family protein, partial [Frankia sp.]